MERRCQKCGWELPRKAKVCPNCGLAVDGEAAGLQGRAQAVPAPSESVDAGVAGVGVSSSLSGDPTPNFVPTSDSSATDKDATLKLLAFIAAAFVGGASVICFIAISLAFVATFSGASAELFLDAEDIDDIVNLYTGIGVALLVAVAVQLLIAARSWRIYKHKSCNTTAFAIVALIFSNIISGVLLLIAEKDHGPRKG